MSHSDPTTAAAPAHPGGRLYGIDLVRGVAMVLMALDHARDYFGDIRVNPVDLDIAGPGLFFTRWITHFCAPVFVLLAGTSAFLWGARGRTRGELSRFLVTRGLWLVVLELTVVKAAWLWSFTHPFHFIQVIAAIGVAMIALGVLVFLPTHAVLGIGLGIVLGHNLLDGVDPERLGVNADLFGLLHVSQTFLAPFEGRAIFFLVIYPLLPWIGVLAVGYGMGPLFQRPAAERRRLLLRLGAAATALFLVLRAGRLYGEPDPWTTQGSPLMTVASFLDCEKYPPSLQYLLMTLGPALVLLALVDREPGRAGRALVTFGRVPLFYYVLHLVVIHGASRLMYGLLHGEYLSPLQVAFVRDYAYPDWFGKPLSVVYAAWIGVVVLLYPLCAWYARLKRRSSSPILSYL